MHLPVVTLPVVRHSAMRATLRTLLMMLLLAMPAYSLADEVSSDVTAPTLKPDWLVLPFAFSTETTGFSLGVGGFFSGWPDPETVVGAALFGNTQDSWGVLSAGRNLRVPLLKNGRLYSDFDLGIGHYPNQRAYFAFKTPVGQTRPGSSNSSDDQYFKGSGWDHWVNLDLKYALPWGDGAERSSGMFWADKGQVGKPGTFPVGWNPLEYGRTWLGTRLARRSVGFDPVPTGAQGNFVSTNNIQIYLKHDGTDKPQDPSRGNKWRFAVRTDPGWGDSLNSWTDLQLDFATHIPLGENSWCSQQVLALDAWTAYAPTFEYNTTGGQITTKHAPPFFTGANLGGLFRMRAYPSSRFNDKASIYYSGEYRSTLRWNPSRDVDLLKPLEIQWLQLVGFVELGNVAQHYSISELHRDIKYDVGVGLRLSIKGAIARIDYAVAPHNSGAWFMIGHAF